MSNGVLVSIELKYFMYTARGALVTDFSGFSSPGRETLNNFPKNTLPNARRGTHENPVIPFLLPFRVFFFLSLSPRRLEHSIFSLRGVLVPLFSVVPRSLSHCPFPFLNLGTRWKSDHLKTGSRFQANGLLLIGCFRFTLIPLFFLRGMKPMGMKGENRTKSSF